MLKTPKFTPAKTKRLESLGLLDAKAILFHYPFRYETFVATPVNTWHEGDTVVFQGTLITRLSNYRFGRRKSISRGQVMIGDDVIHISAFNQPWLSKWEVNGEVSVIGRYEGGNKVLVSRIVQKPIEAIAGTHPVYSLKEGITSSEFQKLVGKCFDINPKENFEDFVPEEFKKRYRLLDTYDALKSLHFPNNEKEVYEAIRTMKYEEFLRFQIVMEERRNVMKADDGYQKSFVREDIEKVKKTLPYALTEDQEKALEEILSDLESTKKMYRLLEGDVGTGKTIVAILGMYAAIQAGYQVVLMAPTEILARQHEKNVQAILEPLGIQGVTLYSGLDNSIREEALDGLRNGFYSYAVGTHALFQEDVEFQKLGFIIIDEQQRFGVEQRKLMVKKGKDADLLMMSATPIPRTLASSLYGDMDVSIIQTYPSHRKPVVTKYIQKNSIIPIKEELEELMDQGNQVFMVCPAIEETEDGKKRNVNQLYENLKKEWEGKYKVGFVHGRLSSKEKDDMMTSFQRQEYDVLITTTVVEVGVDIVHANVMVIYDAQSFGLSQIHQLRGRIGRHGEVGYCYVLSNSKDPDVVDRLTYLSNESNGFNIADYDLKRRGPGDLLGSRQSGIPGFILGDFIEDQKIVRQAKLDAKEILSRIKEFPHIEEYLQTEGKQYFDEIV